jgi:hypothetical protein
MSVLGPEWKIIAVTGYLALPGGHVENHWLADNTIDGNRYNVYFDHNTNTISYNRVGGGSFLGQIIPALVIAAVFLFVYATSNDKVCDTDGCYSKTSIQQTIDANDGQGGY